MATAKATIQKKNLYQKPLADSTTTKDNSSLILGCILFITAIVFSNSIDNTFIINWDDDGYILNNPLIKEFSLAGIKTIFTVPHLDNYHPLTTLSNAIELELFGLNPKPYHVINLMFHLLNTFLVFRFVKSLSGRMEVAAITALFFGIHPMHVESVVWVSERKDLLYTFFFLGSLIAYLKYNVEKKSTYFMLALVLLLCSLLSKPAAVVLSPVLLLIDYYNGRKMTAKVLIEKIPFFALSLFFGILAMHIQQSSGSTNMAPVFPLFDRIFLVSYALVFYIVKLLVPFGLSAIHLYPNLHALTWEYYAAPAMLILLVGLIYKAGEYRKDLIFGTLFFVITIAMVIQIIPVGRSIVSERYCYVPYIGLFFILGKLYCWIIDNKISFAQKIRPYILYIFAGFAIVCLILTWNRNKVWKDSNALFTAAIETNPNDYFGYFARARGELLMEDTRGALVDYNEVVRLNPTYAEGLYSRGVVNEKINVADAVADYTAAIRLSPKHANAFYNRGNLKINAGDYKGALSDYDSSIHINAKNDQAFCNRGAAKVNLGMVNEAIADYDEALRLNPELANAYSNRGNAFLRLGDSTKACEDWHKAVKYGYSSVQNTIQQYCK